MAWNYDDDEINGVIDANIKDSPPNPPAVNTAATVRGLLKVYWAAIRGQVSGAVNTVDLFIATTLLEINEQLNETLESVQTTQTTINNSLATTLHTVETRTAAAEARADSVYTQFSLASGLGIFNATTGIATIKETGTTFSPVLLANQTNGKYFQIVVPGTTSITGTSTLMAVGGYLISRGTKWDYIPPADTGYEKAVDLEKLISANSYESVLLPVLDKVGRLLSGYTLAGEWFASRIKAGSIPKLALAPLDIKLADLNAEVFSQFFQVLDPSTGYIFGILDKAGRIIIGIRTDGSVYIPRFNFTIPDSSIPQTKLDAATQAKLDAGGVVNTNDRVKIGNDNLIRSKMTELSVKTSYNGTEFVPFPAEKTPSISGINLSGQILEFRKSAGMTFRGHKYMGAFTPGAIAEIRDRGMTSEVPSVTAKLQGDFYRIGTINGATLTINSVNYESGDIAVFDAVTSNFIKRAAPSPSGSSALGHFWIVDTAGTFGGVSYAVGDIIYLLARQAAGGPFYRHHYKRTSPGEFFFAGSFTPASFAPPTVLAEGLVYIADSVGTFNGKNFAKNDYLVRINATWHLVASEPVFTIPVNGYFSFKCESADHWEVRRADLSNTPIGVTVNSKTAFVQKQSSDSIAMDGDSMVGMLSLLAAAVAPRPVVSLSYGGGTSEDVKSMIEYNILVKGDPYKGYFHILYHGQNNGGDVAQIKQKTLEMINLSGARDGRFLLLSVLGDRYVTFNGTRLFANAQESAFSGSVSSPLVAVETHYANAYPGNYLNIRKEFLLAAATLTEPDLQFPGMTQAQVAATYGIPPLSYWLDYTTLAYPAAQWNFLGYHNSDSVAPVGGSAKDYYVTNTGISSSTLGALWLNNEGTWTLITWDRIHTTLASRVTFASIIKNWLTTNKQ